VLTWHLPVDDQQQVQPSTKRGSGGTKRFLIPASLPQPAPTADGAKRSLIGVIGKKLLKVLVYPLLDPVIGKVSELFAEHWEQKKRPYGCAISLLRTSAIRTARRSAKPTGRRSPAAAGFCSFTALSAPRRRFNRF
jgi:hypothetical protein